MAQEYDNWETILVDDGSTDGSLALCEKYALADSRIKAYHKENGGVSSACNVGIEKAAGRWITFVDADDKLFTDSLSMLLERTGKADLVFGGYEIFDESENRTLSVKERIELNMDSHQAVVQLFEPKYYPSIGAAWGKLFKTSLIREHNLRFNERIHIGEDRLFVLECLRESGGVLFFTAPVYHYVENSSSAMAAFSKGQSRVFLTDLDAYIEMKRLVKAMPRNERILASLKQSARGNFYWISIANDFRGLRGFVLKLRAHGKLFRILSMKDYIRFVVSPSILSRMS